MDANASYDHTRKHTDPLNSVEHKKDPRSEPFFHLSRVPMIFLKKS